LYALVGDKAQTSAYKFLVNRNVNCAILCRKQYTHAEMSRLADFALLDYRANMRLDNLPLAEMAEVVQEDSEKADTEYFLGFPIALNSEDEEHSAEEHADHADRHPTYYLANHLHFKIKIHPVTKSVVKGRHADGSLIVGFQVIPMSVKHTYDGAWTEGKGSKDKDKASAHPEITSCDANGVKFPHTQLPLPSVQDRQDEDNEETTEVIWTYDVVWEESDVEWASRWDVFLNMKGDKIRWVSIFNSLGVLLLLTGIVAALMLRILRKDLAAYNAVASDEEVAEMQEETGWKLVYADVFRAPTYARAYAVLHGAGAQFFLLVSLTLAFASLGFLSPSNRGSLLTAIVVFFALSGIIAGYVAARLCKEFKEGAQFQITMAVTLAVPGVFFFVFFVVNAVLWSRQSSGAVPFGTLVALISLWCLVSAPLVFIGSFIGFKRDVQEYPCRTNTIPRQIPPQSWLLSTPVCCIVGGILPFGAVFVELFFIVSSIWQHKFYYMFGFLLLVFLIFCITCAEVAVVSTYMQLCSEDYHWWWRSWAVSGSPAFYVFLYGIYQYHNLHSKHQPDATSSFVVYSYLVLASFAIFLTAGFVGAQLSGNFCRRIFGAIKVD